MSKTWKDNQYNDHGTKASRDRRKQAKKAKKDRRKVEQATERDRFAENIDE